MDTGRVMYKSDLQVEVCDYDVIRPCVHGKYLHEECQDCVNLFKQWIVQQEEKHV